MLIQLRNQDWRSRFQYIICSQISNVIMCFLWAHCFRPVYHTSTYFAKSRTFFKNTLPYCVWSCDRPTTCTRSIPLIRHLYLFVVGLWHIYYPDIDSEGLNTNLEPLFPDKAGLFVSRCCHGIWAPNWWKDRILRGNLYYWKCKHCTSRISREMHQTAWIIPKPPNIIWRTSCQVTFII